LVNFGLFVGLGDLGRLVDFGGLVCFDGFVGFGGRFVGFPTFPFEFTG